MQKINSDSSLMSRQIADYAMAMDIMGNMLGSKTEAEVIEKIVELFSMLCSPADIIYLPMLSGSPGELLPLSSCLADREAAKRSLTALQESYAWTSSGNGFILKIGNTNEVLGIIEVDGFTFPEYKQHYLNLALHVVKVLAITILNARNYEALIKTENALHESEERFRALVEDAPEAFYVISADGIITSLNPAFEDITGWHRDEWIGRHFSELIHPDDLPVAKKWFQHVLQGNKTPLHELRVLSKSGEYIIAEFISAPHIKNGKIAGVAGITRNITERKQMEQALHRSEARYRALFTLSPLAIGVADMNHNILMVNQQAVVILDYESQEEVIGKNFSDFIFPEDLQIVMESLSSVMETGGVKGFEFRLKRKDGSLIFIDGGASLVLDYKGNPDCIIAVGRDVTEQKKAEEELKVAYKEAKEKSENLARFNRLMVGRELKMVELKKEVNELLEKLGQKRRYETPERIKKAEA